MPPKLKVGKKGKGKRRKGKKGKKKKKKVKPDINGPPIHNLTTLYNALRDKMFDMKRTQVRARKKRLEGWFMTREMLNLKHDNQVYHDYLTEKMDEIERLLEDIRKQLEIERAEVDRLIRERMAEYQKKIDEYKKRIIKGEMELNELKLKLQEYDPLIKQLAALIARLKELQALVPKAMLDANIKTRYLKNQYLNERARLHNHLERELYDLITNCRSHLMPILCDHMHKMEFENRCNRWALSKLDIANAKFNRKKELLLEKRNRLNMERGYLSLDWAFSKLAQVEKRKREEKERLKNPIKPPPPPEECELSIAFKRYLNKKLIIARAQQDREAKLQKRREEKEHQLSLEHEKARKSAEKAKQLMEELGLSDEDEDWDEDEFDWWDDDDDEMEYYENADGTVVMAPAGRMKQHRALMENKSLEDLEDESGSDEGDEDEDEDAHSRGSTDSSGSGGIRDSFDDDVNVNSNEQDYGQDDDDDMYDKRASIGSAPDISKAVKAIQGKKDKKRKTKTSI